MHAFVVLRLVFYTKARDWLGERLQNELFCFEWDVNSIKSDVGKLYVYK